MPNFKYRVRDKYGKAASGIIAGEDKGAVAKHLGTMGYVPISIEQVGKIDSGITLFSGFFNNVKPEELNSFTRQLLTLQRAGVSMLSSLDIMEKQTKNKYFKDVLKEITAKVEGGTSLSDAMSRYPAIFNELYVNMVKAGEASGLLDDMLERLSRFGEKEIETSNNIKSATRYPLITLGALFVAFIVVVTFVIPKFANVFKQFKTALPLPTTILLNLSFLLKHYWYLFIIAAAAIIYAAIRYVNTKKGRLFWDSFKLKVPIFGALNTMFVMEKFARTMSILIKSGLPILQVLEMVSKTVDNAELSRIVNNIAINVKDGKKMSEPMETSGLFPPIVIQMVAVGEDTGKLDELLMKVSEYYEQQSDYMLKNLTTVIEPLFILILGAMVLTMALAIFLPMWSMFSLFK